MFGREDVVHVAVGHGRLAEASPWKRTGWLDFGTGAASQTESRRLTDLRLPGNRLTLNDATGTNG